jgi:hypothetical protein
MGHQIPDLPLREEIEVQALEVRKELVTERLLDLPRGTHDKVSPKKPEYGHGDGYEEHYQAVFGNIADTRAFDGQSVDDPFDYEGDRELADIHERERKQTR